MNTTEHIRSANSGRLTPVEVSAELIEGTGGGLRIAELGVVILLGLLVCPPLLILAVVVAVPLIAISAAVAAAVVAIVVPAVLVRHVLAHHRAHGSTLFHALGTRLGTSTDATRGLLGDLRHVQHQQEGTS
jgi:hypothetical protein